MRLPSQRAATTDASCFCPKDAGMDDATMCMANFIERWFIPNHVELKSVAGRIHYQAIMKHILKPETVDRLFTPYVGMAKARLRAVPGWPYLDDVRLCDLTPDRVRQITSSACVSGYSPQTVKHIRNVIGAIISHARREHIFSGDNPISAVELPPMTRKTRHDLTIVQTKTILRLMQYPEREIALIMISTGISVSEICALQWKHINSTRSTIYSDRQLIPPRSILIKKKWSVEGVVDVNVVRRRHIELSQPLINELMNLRRRRNVTTTDDFGIVTHTGAPLRPPNLLNLRLKPIGTELDMPWLSWQVLTRAHSPLLSPRRIQLTDDLILSA